MITIVRAEQITAGCPAQWHAWDANGRYYYLRYRYGTGTVEADTVGGQRIATFSTYDPLDPGSALDGFIELHEFANLAGITLERRTRRQRSLPRLLSRFTLSPPDERPGQDRRHRPT